MAIAQSVFELVQTQGIVNLSMAKIAKLANVSVRTIYIYYQDKEDLLGQLYLAVKLKIDAGLAEQLATTADLFEQLAVTIAHFAQAYNRWPNEMIYMRAIQQNPELVSHEVHKQTLAIALPIFQMYERMQASVDFKHLPVETFTAIAAGAMNMMIEQAIVCGRPISEEQIAVLIVATQDAVRA
ncbi:TetR/AcrR family transcriptional regulator [Lactococcus hodotermopsidis]|nr:TetR/AcrR family transcriptional regulator [Lactococcus hodotermopsidis]